MLKLYKKTIIWSIIIVIITSIIAIIFNHFSLQTSIASLIENYAIGVSCSLFVIIITTCLQYQTEKKRIKREYSSSLMSLFLSIMYAYSNEAHLNYPLINHIYEQMLDGFGKIQVLSEEFCSFSEKEETKYRKLYQNILQLYTAFLRGHSRVKWERILSVLQHKKLIATFDAAIAVTGDIFFQKTIRYMRQEIKNSPLQSKKTKTDYKKGR